MTITHDENAASWRDLTDQLTPAQIAELEYCERQQVPPGISNPQNQLNHARKMAELNIARAIFADIAPPADAIGDVNPWSDYGEDLYERMFTSWRHPAVDVVIVGSQYSDGSVERFIMCEADTENLSAANARQVARALTAAAERLEGLA